MKDVEVGRAVPVPMSGERRLFAIELSEREATLTPLGAGRDLAARVGKGAKVDYEWFRIHEVMRTTEHELEELRSKLAGVVQELPVLC